VNREQHGETKKEAFEKAGDTNNSETLN